MTKNLPTVLIAEDEPLAREHIYQLANDTEWLGTIHQVVDGEAAKLALDKLQPDIVFMDINRPKMSGLEALKLASHQPKVIFTTALDEYGVLAFELGAIDYLLKPFSRKRFNQAMNRLRFRLIEPTENIGYLDQLNTNTWENLPFIFVRNGNKINKIETKLIEWIEGDGEYMKIHLQNHEYLIKVRLYQLIQLLDPNHFIQIHRSRVINIKQIKELKKISNGKFEVTFISDNTTSSSRKGAIKLKALML